MKKRKIYKLTSKLALRAIIIQVNSPRFLKYKSLRSFLKKKLTKNWKSSSFNQT